MANFLDLPTELIITILSKLSFYDVVPCQTACRTLYRIVKDSSLLQYQHALELGGFSNNPNHQTLSIPERLQKVTSANRAWLRSDADFVETVDIYHDPSGIYDLTAGVYLLGNITRHALHYTCLPSNPLDDTSWHTIKIKQLVIDMGLCIEEHDLIVVVTSSPLLTASPRHDIALTLLEFSTGNPHPLARETRIPVFKNRWERPAIGIEIVGENLVLILTHYNNPWQPEDRVFIYNWKTGALKTTLAAPYHTYAGIIFLTEHLVLLPNTHKGTFEIWDIPRKAGDPSPTVPLCILSLPALAPGQVFSNISCRCEPNPMGAGAAPRSTKRPYISNPQEAIIIFNVHVLPANIQPGNPPLGHTYSFFIHRKSILQCMTDELLSSTRHTEPIRDTIDIDFPNKSILLPTPVPWAKWGPTVTRWITADSVPTRWITTSAGQRCVLIAEIARHSGFQFIVLDFNLANVKKRKWFEQERDSRQAKDEKGTPVGEACEMDEENENEINEQRRTSKAKAPERPLPAASALSLGNPVHTPVDDDEWEDLSDPGESLEEMDEDEMRALVMSQLMEQQVLPYQMAGPSTVIARLEEDELVSTEDDVDEDAADSTAATTSSVRDANVMETAFDVNDSTPLAASSNEDGDADGEDRIWCITEMQTVDAGHSFSEPVVSYLPYVASASKQRHFYDGVLMDEERVLGLVTDPLDRIQKVDVHHFG